MKEPLEDLCGIESAKDVQLLLDAQRRRNAFDMLLDPALLLRVLDVHVLDAERPAVGVAEHGQDLVERGGRR